MYTVRSPVRAPSSKREVVGSNPAVGKSVFIFNSRFRRVDHSSNQQIQMKATMTYTQPILCFR